MTPYLLDERWLARIGTEDASIFEAWINWADSSRMSEFHRAVIAHRFLEAAQVGTSEQVARLGWIMQSMPDWPLCTGVEARGWTGRMRSE